MVFGRLDPNDARRLGGAKAERERRRERDRHLSDQLAHTTSADDTGDPIHLRDRFQPSFEHGEQRAVVALVDDVLARHEADVRRDPSEPLALDRAEIREDGDASDLVRRHHGTRHSSGTTVDADALVMTSLTRPRLAASGRPAANRRGTARACAW